MPVFNDWDSGGLLCAELARLMPPIEGVRTEVLLVDDGSTESADPEALAKAAAGLGELQILRLRRNLGHQRAIAIGLAHLSEEAQADAVLVMDADGQDRPQDAVRLLEAFRSSGGARVVFAERRKRLEGPVFQTFYALYRLLHWLLTGRRVRFGNFSILPRAGLESLVVVPELWTHYAAAIVKSRLPFGTIHTDRGARLRGHSHMDFVALVTHGLGAIAVFRELVGTRLLIGLSVLSAAAILVSTAAPALFHARGDTLSSVLQTELLLILLLQIVGGGLALAFGVLGSRDTGNVLPVRDYKYYVRGSQRLL